MALNVPTELNYNQLQTRAFFSMFKAWPIQPANNGGQYYPGQVIRIFLTALTDGVLDPYRSHLQVTVQCDANTLPVGSLQLDNSAQSLIQQLVVTSKNRQVERILEYGVLAAYLSDIGLSQMYAQGRQQQGYGYNNVDNFSSMVNQPQSPAFSTIWMGQDFDDQVTIGRNASVFPTIPNRSTLLTCRGTQSTAISQLAGVFKGHINWVNPAWLGPTINQVWWWYDATDISTQPCTDTFDVAGFAYYGYLNNVRAEYLSSFSANDYCDSTTSFSKAEMQLNLNQEPKLFPPKFTNTTSYNIQVPPYLKVYNSYHDKNGTIQNYSFSAPNTTAVQGFGSLISPNFAKGVRQPFISPTVPQCQIQNGRILPTKIPILTKTFKFPLLSSVLGILIPQNQFVLLPLRTLNDTYLEFTLDQHAFFTSGYNDVSQFDNVGMGLMQKRAFKVTRVVYNLHTYQFYSPQMDQYLKISINSGIAINTHFWQMANQYSIENSQSITNAWPIACNQEALNQVLVLFYSNDYQKLSFCRKHFRLSNNITKFQLRINMEYFPTQPLSGNAGNPIQLDQTGDNGVFLDQIQFATGYRFSNAYPTPRINAYNFAINERCYDAYNSNTMYDAQIIGNINFNWGLGSINYDTALGMANIHQNRYVGKAAYLYSFQPYGHSKQFISGIDCRKTNQFDVIFNANPDGYYPRSQTMFIYTKSSNIMEYNKDGIININK